MEYSKLVKTLNSDAVKYSLIIIVFAVIGYFLLRNYPSVASTFSGAALGIIGIGAYVKLRQNKFSTP